MGTMSKYSKMVWLGLSLYRRGYISWGFLINQIEQEIAYNWPTSLNDEILAEVE